MVTSGSPFRPCREGWVSCWAQYERPVLPKCQFTQFWALLLRQIAFTNALEVVIFWPILARSAPLFIKILCFFITAGNRRIFMEIMQNPSVPGVNEKACIFVHFPKGFINKNGGSILVPICSVLRGVSDLLSSIWETSAPKVSICSVLGTSFAPDRTHSCSRSANFLINFHTKWWLLALHFDHVVRGEWLVNRFTRCEAGTSFTHRVHFYVTAFGKS